MNNKKRKYKEYEIPFWGEWLDADLIKREDMVENLPIIREILDVNKLPKKIRKRSFTLILNSFFEDLESAIYTKIRLENKKKKKSKS